MRGGGVRDRGYTLVALLVGMTVMMILIAAALPLASTQAQRSKEDDLIFRGLQYAEGIRVFKRRYGRYPTSLKEMLDVRPRTLRKLWTDPMTGKVDWVTISLTTLMPLPGSGSGTSGKRSSGSFLPSPNPTPTPGAFGPPGGAAGGQVLGPITGVRSRSTKKGYRVRDGRDVYSEWLFTEQSLTNASGHSGAMTPGGLPGPGIGGGTTLPPPGSGVPR